MKILKFDLFSSEFYFNIGAHQIRRNTYIGLLLTIIAITKNPLQISHINEKFADSILQYYNQNQTIIPNLKTTLRDQIEEDNLYNDECKNSQNCQKKIVNSEYNQQDEQNDTQQFNISKQISKLQSNFGKRLSAVSDSIQKSNQLQSQIINSPRYESKYQTFTFSKSQKYEKKVSKDQQKMYKDKINLKQENIEENPSINFKKKIVMSKSLYNSQQIQQNQLFDSQIEENQKNNITSNQNNSKLKQLGEYNIPSEFLKCQESQAFQIKKETQGELATKSFMPSQKYSIKQILNKVLQNFKPK
ncbi:hypothetical protein ABPG73_009672 [Tetrahymena malaccensis]